MQEFEFTQRDFMRVRDMIYQRAGISLSEQKQEMVYGRLARRLRVLGMATFSEYLDALQHDSASEEWVAFTNALTTNLTSFFREAHHFPLLADYVQTCTPPISIWCAASSTGEEPYSIAMTVCEAFDSLTPPVRIFATDIDTTVLETARAGIYPEERLNRMPENQARRFFLRGRGRNQGKVRVRPQLQQLIRFDQVNLLAASWPDTGPYDLIFCRNVMIYFDKPTQARILSRFEKVLKPGGLLFAGHSENFLNITDRFSLLGKTVYALNR